MTDEAETLRRTLRETQAKLKYANELLAEVQRLVLEASDHRMGVWQALNAIGRTVRETEA